MKKSLINYLEYRDSDNEFSYAMRMAGFVWDDKNYKYMLSLIREVLLDYKKDDVIPKILVFFFGFEIPIITGTISHPSFLINPPTPYSEQEYANLIEQRKDELLKIQKNFFCGMYDEI